MQTPNKNILKTVTFWQILIWLVVVIFLGIAVKRGLSESAALNVPGETEPPQISVADTLPNEETTDTTLPPPAENPYGPLDFRYEGDYLTCLAGEAALGIDVSTWQGNIDWQQVKDAGIEYVLIRAGYRSTDTGNLGEDNYAQRNYQGASEAGLKVGAYFFSQAITVEEAENEARFLLSLIQDWDIQMPLVYDWEYVDETARTAGMSARELTDCTKAFCEVVEKAGYESMIYFNEDQSHKQMYLEELTDYGFWLAMYDKTMNYPYRIDMWQYTSEGKVPGIDGNVDMNLFFTYE